MSISNSSSPEKQTCPNCAGLRYFPCGHSSHNDPRNAHMCNTCGGSGLVSSEIEPSYDPINRFNPDNIKEIGEALAHSSDPDTNVGIKTPAEPGEPIAQQRYTDSNRVSETADSVTPILSGEAKCDCQCHTPKSTWGSCKHCAYEALPGEPKTPMGVSQWREHGKKYGYWDYFEAQVKPSSPSEAKYCNDCELARLSGMGAGGIEWFHRKYHAQPLPSSPSEATEQWRIDKMSKMTTDEAIDYIINKSCAVKADIKALIAHKTQQRAEEAYAKGLNEGLTIVERIMAASPEELKASIAQTKADLANLKTPNSNKGGDK